jgi:hypothetical protein
MNSSLDANHPACVTVWPAGVRWPPSMSHGLRSTTPNGGREPAMVWKGWAQPDPSSDGDVAVEVAQRAGAKARSVRK